MKDIIHMDDQQNEPGQSWKAWANLVTLLVALLIGTVVFGWFGLALVGLFGMVITRPDDIAVPGYNYTDNALDIVAKQIEARDQDAWQNGNENRGNKATRFIETFNWNVLWVPMIILGLYMFARQQF
jgi:hypothetical protein